MWFLLTSLQTTFNTILCVLLVRLERENLQQEKDVLLRKLLEAELDSTAAAKQALALRDAVSRMSRTVSVSSLSHCHRLRTAVLLFTDPLPDVEEQRMVYITVFSLRRSGWPALTLRCWPGRRISSCRSWKLLRGRTEHCAASWGSSMTVRCRLTFRRGSRNELELWCLLMLISVFSITDGFTSTAGAERLSPEEAHWSRGRKLGLLSTWKFLIIIIIIH